MSSFRATIVTAVLTTLLLTTGNASAAPKQQTDQTTANLAAAASPMTADALEKLYSGRTWQWGKNGGGFFSSSANKRGLGSAAQKGFVAQTRNGYGKGYWYVTDGGKLCMRALWSAKNSPSSGAVTCFLHREKDGVVYQRASLGGQWYVFRHNPERNNDEARKLVEGDQVSKELPRFNAIRP